MLRRFAAGILWVVTLACFGHREEAALRRRTAACPTSSQRAWTPDSTVSLCVPAGFTARGPRRFARARGDSLPEHWIAVSIDSASDHSADEPWPVTLASGPQCSADCTTVDALRVSTDTIAGAPAHTEVGLVSGGISGEVRLPAYVASAELRPGLRLIVHAYSPDTLLLDSLRAAVRTIELGRRAPAT
jgi:hypothetical protein